MRRVINFRAPLFVAIALILGIFSFYEFLFGDFWFGLLTLIVFVAIGVLLLVFKNKIRMGMLAVIVALLLGFFLSQLNYYLIIKDEVIEREVFITGRVSDINRNGSDSAVYYLEDCVDEDGVKYNGRVKTYIFDGSYITGDILTIHGVLHSLYPIKEPLETYYLRPNIRYELETETIVLRADGHMKLDEVIRKYIYDTTDYYAPMNGDVLYALLTGDRSAMSSEKEVYFKSSGIIHLLAVSGLHVGFIVAILGFVLKRFKFHPLIEGGIMLIPLVLYAFICRFSPSIIRAIVMIVCTYLTRAVFGRYDLLTSLSFATIVILLISPFNLFDLGFQLSLLSVYGIATLYPPINRWLSKRKLPVFVKRIVNSLAISLSCSVATFFTLQLNYGYAPVLGILLNVVVIPLVTVVFVLGVIGMLPWVFHYILFAADWILEVVVIMAKWVAGLSFSTAFVPAIAITTVVVVLWLFVLGGYVNLRKRGKIILNSVLASLMALCIGLSFVKLPSCAQVYVAYGYDDTMCVVTSLDGETAIVGNFSDLYSYQLSIDYVGKYNVDSCVLYITDYGVANEIIIANALESLPIQEVYKLNFADNADVDNVLSTHHVAVYQQAWNESTGNSVIVTSVYDGELRAVIMRTGGMVATSVYGDDYAVANYLDLQLQSDIYILPRANKAYSDNNLITLSYYQSQIPFNYGANKYGTFTITQKGATIRIKFR